MALTTLDKVLNELKGTEAKFAPGTEQQIMGYIRTVTGRIRRFNYAFEPYYEVKNITANPGNVDTHLGTLALNEMLLEPFSIVVNNTTVSYGADVLPYPNNGQSPIYTLRIANPFSGPIRTWYPRDWINCSNWIENVQIAAFWGLRTYYSTQGFFNSEVSCPALTAGQASFIVSDVAGPDIYSRTPLFSPGNLLRIDNELIEITKVATDTKTLTVLRGMFGTTAVDHTLGTTIFIWEPEEAITNMATRQVGLLYARRGAYMNMTTLPEGVSVTYPSDLLAEIRATIQEYQFVGNQQ